ncbi:MAG TPA: DUF4037 domain-containing protein [Roseiflexaceae bacterium]|nr:DUF4037 domain-containing protein [Roseiflexaceae bacterium]
MAPTEQQLAAARRVAAAAVRIPGVLAVSLGGSFSYGLADAASDLDLHTYVRAPLADNAARAAQLAAVADPDSLRVGVTTWGLEDHLRVDGRLVELVYVDLDELLASAGRAYGEGIVDEAFVTAQLAYVAGGTPLVDSTGELAALRGRLLESYPEPTRRALLRDNPGRLRAYLAQLRTAQARGDLLYVQHRRYSVQLVFFNLLFALNRYYHPGEKRLHLHGERCPLRPRDLTERWMDIARLPADDMALADLLGELVDELLELAEKEQ